MKIFGAVFVVGLLFCATGCPNQAHNDSMTALANGNKASGAKQYEQAVTEYQKAVDKFHENHLAWYGMGGAWAQRGDWTKASDAFTNAVQIAPEQAMYQMWYGIALYNKAVQVAKEEQAKKLNKKPEEVIPDLSGVNFEKPMQHLQEATKLNNDMWRAHYFLGKIYREVDKPKEAAEELSKALQANPRESGPYVALGELYRRWDYTDEAIKVASQGTNNVPGSNEVSDIWFVLGMGYDDKRANDKAIEAFSKAIESRKDNHKAKFQRGQAYFRMNDTTHAKRDLEEFSKSGGASLEFAKQQASKMLMDIAAKSAGDAPKGPEMKSPEELVNGPKGGKGKKH
ncbi:MAG: Tetratricopeptide 2 repeat protein [Myxococcales bacterium]|nr:Tetratricopeptide 2 repeat protein [Myxococcales bacterium]